MRLNGALCRDYLTDSPLCTCGLRSPMNASKSRLSLFCSQLSLLHSTPPNPKYPLLSPKSYYSELKQQPNAQGTHLSLFISSKVLVQANISRAMHLVFVAQMCQCKVTSEAEQCSKVFVAEKSLCELTSQSLATLTPLAQRQIKLLLVAKQKGNVLFRQILYNIQGSSTYYVITFGGPERPLPPM